MKPVWPAELSPPFVAAESRTSSTLSVQLGAALLNMELELQSVLAPRVGHGAHIADVGVCWLKTILGLVVYLELLRIGLGWRSCLRATYDDEPECTQCCKYNQFPSQDAPPLFVQDATAPGYHLRKTTPFSCR